MPGALTMGNVGAKRAPGRRKKSSKNAKDEKEENKWIVSPENEVENKRFQEMKRLAREEPNVFILNNLVLSLQPFTNYNEEINKAREKVKAREEELNKKFIPEKNVLVPDVLREHFNGRMKFTSHCKEEQTVEPLRPLQMYLVYENVIVTELEDSRHYSTTGDVSVEYTFVLKEADHKGYARLQLPSNSMIKRSQGSDITNLSSISENRDVIYSEDESVYGPLRPTNGASSMPNLLDEEIYYEGHTNSGSTQDLQSNASNSNSKINGTPHVRMSRGQRTTNNVRFRASGPLTNPSSASSSSSGYATTYNIDSDSDVSYLSRSRLHYLANGKPVDPVEIPSRCFKRVTYMYNDRIYNPRKEQKPLTSQQRRIREEKLAHNYDVVYVNGYRFAKHFYEVFKSQLAEKMNFDRKDVLSAKRCGATIRLEKIDYLNIKKYTSIEQYEVIPCFASRWPQWALGWLKRPRGNWPTEEDLEVLECLNCYLVPESIKQAIPNSESSHPLWQLDWCLTFPAAERYLETCLSASQITVYTIALMIHKTFIRSVSSTFGLDTRHIRNMLFWMVEKQPDWSEHELGKSMIILLERLHKHVQQRKMDDYFMNHRNVFANVDTDGLLHSQKQLKRIIDNPVMFVFHAMEKIHYENDDYPRLDYEELLRLLTVNELILISPQLELHLQKEPQQANSPLYKKHADKKFWNEAKQTNQIYMQTRKRVSDTFINPRRVSDTIIEIEEKCEPLSSIRLAHLLSFFAKHFLKMARCCQNFGTAYQKRVYLDQTKLLALQLYEIPEFEDKAREIVEEIAQLRAIDIVVPATQSGPETPRRNADQPIFAGSLNNRHTHGRPSTVIEEAETNNNNLVEVEVHTMQKSALKKMTRNGVATNGEEKISVETTEF